MVEHLKIHDADAGALPPRRNGLYRVCVATAGLGGLLLFAAAVMVTASVVMRMLGLGGIRGDFEAVELVCAACASLFLPLCQYNKGHVMVDLFTLWMPARAQRRLDGVWTLLFAAFWAVLCWRLCLGLAEMHDYGDRTMLLRVPVWLVYVPAILGVGLTAVIALLNGLTMTSTVFRAWEIDR